MVGEKTADFNIIDALFDQAAFPVIREKLRQDLVLLEVLEVALNIFLYPFADIFLAFNPNKRAPFVPLSLCILAGVQNELAYLPELLVDLLVD